jgi:hypothetical protein
MWLQMQFASNLTRTQPTAVLVIVLDRIAGESSRSTVTSSTNASTNASTNKS